MAAKDNTFERVETKYTVDTEKMQILLKEFGPYMEVDNFGRETICSIYYDNDNFDLINKSLEKPIYKEKLRIRSYGTPGPDSEVFAEVKKKYKGVVYKRRLEGTEAEVMEFLSPEGIKKQAKPGNFGVKNEAGGRGPENEGQAGQKAGGPSAGQEIEGRSTEQKTEGLSGQKTGSSETYMDRQVRRELQWMVTRYDLKPRVFIAYERTALREKNGGGIRITFDENMRFRTDRLKLSEGSDGKLIAEKGLVTMEIKVPGGAPKWMTEILGKYRIYPNSFSKYGTAYKNHFAQMEASVEKPGPDAVWTKKFMKKPAAAKVN